MHKRQFDREAVRAASPCADVIGDVLEQQPDQSEKEPRFRCPWHEDSRPSLRVNVSKGVWRCDPCGFGGDVYDFLQRFQGCEFPKALAFLAERAGIEPSTPQAAAGLDVLAEYDYCDEQGLPLFQVCRVRPAAGKSKDFRQRRRVDGRWVWNLGDARRVLFGLPELKGQPVVYVVEGEKDVLTLRGINLVATTNAGGAGKWLDIYAAQLKSQGVESAVVLPDHDEPGRQHAASVARSCAMVGLRVKVVSLPVEAKGADVSDWLAAGHSRTDLVALVKATPEYVVPNSPEPSPNHGPQAVMIRMSDVSPQPITWYWPGRIPIGKLSIIAGDPGMGKSWISLDIAARGSRGLEWPDGGAPPTGDVILLSAEDVPEDTIRPRLDSLGADATRVHAFTQVLDDGLRMPVLSRDLDLLEREIARTGAKLVIIDPISAYLGDVDAHRDAEVRGVLAPVANLAAKTGTAIVVVMHLSKGGQRPALYRAMGSIAFVAAARLVLAVAPHPDDDKRRVLTPIKSNICVPAATLSYQLADGRLLWDSAPVLGVDADTLLGGNAREVMNEISSADEWLREQLEDGPVKVLEVEKQAKAAGVSMRSLERAKHRIGVGTKKIGFNDGWVWHLPKAATLDDVAAFGDKPARIDEFPKEVPKAAEGRHGDPLLAAFAPSGGVDGDDFERF